MRDMKGEWLVVRDWRPMKDFGVDVLTGEACGLGMRLLCDLTAAGADLIREFFSLSGTNFPFARNWNHGTDEDPHVASVMLPVSIFRDLAAFAMLENGYVTVITTTKQAIYGFTDHRDAEEYLKLIDANRDGSMFGHHEVLRKRGTAGTRNVHEMSGRVE